MSDSNQKTVKARDVGLPDYFDMQADLGHTKHLGGWIATQDLAELCQLGEGQELLYVGCGSGVAAIKIAEEYGCRVVGVDLLDSMVQAAREWAVRRGATDRTEFRAADAQDLPFEGDRFDVLICESVNTFVPDLNRAAREYVRVVKPGGFVGMNEGVWIQTPPEQGVEIIGTLTGQRIRDSEEWVAMLKEAGLVDIVERTFAIEMKREARAQFGFLSLRDYLRILGRFFTKSLFTPNTREIMKLALSEPSSVYKYMGYGLFVGKKPIQNRGAEATHG